MTNNAVCSTQGLASRMDRWIDRAWREGRPPGRVSFLSLGPKKQPGSHRGDWPQDREFSRRFSGPWLQQLQPFPARALHLPTMPGLGARPPSSGWETAPLGSQRSDQGYTITSLFLHTNLPNTHTFHLFPRTGKQVWGGTLPKSHIYCLHHLCQAMIHKAGVPASLGFHF